MVRKFWLASFLVVLSFPSYGLNCELKSQQDLSQEILDEIERNPISCSRQKVHLTFDDGPSPDSTPHILSELNRRGIKASFFVTTTNLESSPRNASIVRDILNSGHLIANHGHEHNAYDLRMGKNGEVLETGFTQREREAQISKSVRLLNEATNNKFQSQAIKLFRFPYGRGAMPSRQELQEMSARGEMKFTSSDYAAQLAQYRAQSPALQTLAGNNFSHLGWNHDSEDSSYNQMKDRRTLKNYILKNIRTLCSAKTTQVALFHDIKRFNVEAIPVIADIGECLGLNFISAQEMYADSASLERSGVLLRKRAVEAAPVDAIADLLRKIESNKPEVECEEKETEKSCYSEYSKKYFKECESGDSICLGGRWYARRDPMVILNCKLND